MFFPILLHVLKRPIQFAMVLGFTFWAVFGDATRRKERTECPKRVELTEDGERRESADGIPPDSNPITGLAITLRHFRWIPMTFWREVTNNNTKPVTLLIKKQPHTRSAFELDFVVFSVPDKNTPGERYKCISVRLPLLLSTNDPELISLLQLQPGQRCQQDIVIKIHDMGSSFERLRVLLNEAELKVCGSCYGVWGKDKWRYLMILELEMA